MTGDEDGNLCMWGSMDPERPQGVSISQPKDTSMAAGTFKLSARQVVWCGVSYRHPIVGITEGRTVLNILLGGTFGILAFGVSCRDDFSA